MKMFKVDEGKLYMYGVVLVVFSL